MRALVLCSIVLLALFAASCKVDQLFSPDPPPDEPWLIVCQVDTTKTPIDTLWCKDA